MVSPGKKYEQVVRPSPVETLTGGYAEVGLLSASSDRM